MSRLRRSMRCTLLILLMTLLVAAQPPREAARVVRVVDGDTLRVRIGAGSEIKLRLIGIDTPEVQAGERLSGQARDIGVEEHALEAIGHRASARATELVSGGEVWLEYDEERLDRYGRTLAYVWLDEQTMLNEKLLAEGLATPLPVGRNLRHEERFAQTARSARSARLGVWAIPPVRASPSASPSPRPSEPEPAEEGLPLGWMTAALVLMLLTATALFFKQKRRVVVDEEPSL